MFNSPVSNLTDWNQAQTSSYWKSLINPLNHSANNELYIDKPRSLLLGMTYCTENVAAGLTAFIFLNDWLNFASQAEINRKFIHLKSIFTIDKNLQRQSFSSSIVISDVYLCKKKLKMNQGYRVSVEEEKGMPEIKYEHFFSDLCGNIGSFLSLEYPNRCTCHNICPLYSKQSYLAMSTVKWK